MFDMDHFRTRLQKQRKELGLTQNELAELLNVSAQSVSYWECGKGVPDIENLCRIADVLSISLDTLLQRDDRPLPKTLIGVDAGGTKTEFALIDEYGNRLDSAILSGSNPNICGIKAAINTINALLGWVPMCIAAVMLVVVFFHPIEKDTAAMRAERGNV